jgi:hypothetical protein
MNESRAETLKLARLLRRDPEQLAYLEAVPASDIRALREQVTEMLFSAQGPMLGRLAAASKLLPTAVIAAIGEHAFGPVLSARIAGLLEPSRAVEVGTKLPTSFLADVTVEIDPRRASDLISRVPPEQVADVTRELVAREEYVTMGRFVGHLPDAAIRASLDVMDDRALLQTAFVLDDQESLRHIAMLLAPERRYPLTRAGAELGLWSEPTPESTR